MPGLPSGTVTFLFTAGVAPLPSSDEQTGDSLQDAAASSAEALGGHVFKRLGPGAIAVAFDRASEALSAALEIQREAEREAQGQRIRVALHSGAAVERDGDYFGPVLNRVARLLEVAHPGQILLTLATEQLAHEQLPDGVGLRDLGSHRLRDLGRPEQVFQLLHPDLRGDFPALVSLDAVLHNLPIQPTRFVGREREMAELNEQLESAALVTLTGPGGTGKTRLALQAAGSMLDRFPEGVWLVELAALAEGDLLPQTVATALGLREEPGRPWTDTLIDYLDEGRRLLILDNCEHLLPACAGLVEALLQRCPDLRVLATSREPLAIGGEQVLRVPSLTLPPERRNGSTLEDLGRIESVALFTELAAAAKPGFDLTESNRDEVLTLCRRLDGLPLALALAAARLRVLTPGQVTERLDRSFRLLSGGSRTALPRQQTLWATLDWSYGLLDSEEQLLFQRLSVFAGGFTLEAAEAVCADGEQVEDWAVLDLLSQLVDKSLVEVEEGEPPRYRLLQTVEQYAVEKLRASDEQDALRGRHLAYYLELADLAEPNLMGPGAASWLGRLDRELANLRRAFEWTPGQGQSSHQQLYAAAKLGRYWAVRGHLSEGRSLLIRLLDRADSDADIEPQADARFWAAELARLQADFEAAHAGLRRALEAYREIGDPKRMGAAIRGLGIVAWHRGNMERAQARFEACLSLAEESGELSDQATALNNLGMLSRLRAEYDEAERYYERSLALYGRMGDRAGSGPPLHNLGMVAQARGDPDTARRRLEEALAIFREIGHRQNESSSLTLLGELAAEQDEIELAMERHSAALAIRRELGARQGIGSSICSLGALALRQGDVDSAEPQLKEALDIFREIGDGESEARARYLLGSLALQTGQLDAAREDLGASLALQLELGAQAEAIGTLTAFAHYHALSDRAQPAFELSAAAERLRSDLGVRPDPYQHRLLDEALAVHRSAVEDSTQEAWLNAGAELDLDAAAKLAQESP